MNKIKNYQSGFGAIEALLILVIVVLIGGVGWYVVNAKNKADNSLSSANQAAESTLPKIAAIKTYDDCVKASGSKVNKKVYPETCTTKAGKKFDNPAQKPQSLVVIPSADGVTTVRGKPIALKVPEGWVLSDEQSKLEKSFGGTKYLLSFQLTEEDYLKLPAYETTGNLTSVTSAGGKKITLVKIQDSNIALSSCSPSGTKACSLVQDGRTVLVFVSTPGTGGPGEINFSDPAVKSLIDEVKTITQSIEL